MASHRRPKPPTRTRVTVLTATAAAAVALTSQAAHADPKPTKSEVKAKVDKLYDESEKANEKYSGAKEQQDKIEKQVAAIQDKVARGQDELNDLREGLGSMASAQYRSGGIDPSIQLFLSADPDSYLEKASTMDQISAEQAKTLQQVSDKQRALAQERKEASGKLADLSSARKDLASKKKDVQDKLKDAQTLFNTLSAAEKASLAADDSRANRASDRVNLGNVPAASGRAAAAFAAAQRVIGSPYVYGATGPGSFDCSGLTQWAYGQAGVSITRTTYTQADEGVRIGMSQLAPGDLVFFNGLAHVGLYAGNGQVLHAPHPGASVRFESMSTIGGFMYGVRI
ncbi:NlpC/P60 family protein [Streptomyces sp. 150FB]|uniref:C40 family peptidase n=1 Tax=Streptomyces sp. 150FB TaxID=1576605 RepID=UPI00099D3FF4|nr:NlpC/P60 family protein [Streptomyces sp. 150FB]